MQVKTDMHGWSASETKYLFSFWAEEYVQWTLDYVATVTGCLWGYS